MAYPDYIPTRAVTLGGAMGLESSNLIKIVATVTASRPLIWQATGYRFESMAHTVQAEAGMEMSLSLPCTDSPGWKDARTGALIDVSAADSYSHRYTVKLSFLDENGKALAIPQYTVGPFVLPAEDGSPVDLDKMVPTSSTAGDQVAVPDSWTASVSAAESLAAEAQAMLEAATADPDAGTLVRRREGGTVAVGTATAGDEAIPMAQLDALVAAQVTDQDTELSAALSSTYGTLAGGSYVDAAAAANARTLMGLLHRGVSNAQILVIGDSTGNEPTEWVYGLAAWLGSLYPAYTVTYYHWDETGGTAYEAPITVQTGTGAVTLTVYNCSVAGSRPGYVLGSRWAAAVAALAPDLIMVSHGHNTGGAPPTDASPRNILRGGATNSLAQIVCQLGFTHPAAPITLIAQNPSATSGRETWQAIKASIYERGASILGYGMIDVHQAFIDYGAWNPALMADTQHPNTAGQALWLEVVKQAFRPAALKGSPARWMPSPLTRYQPNLAPNPLFSSWASTNPDSWGTFTYCAPTKDTTNFETGTYGMKLTSDATNGTAFAELSVSIADKLHLRGKLITVAARIRVPASNTATVRLTAYDDGGSGNSTATDMDSTTRDGWVWLFTPHLVYATSNTIRIRISPRTSGTSIVECTVDRVWIGEGILPNVAQMG